MANKRNHAPAHCMAKAAYSWLTARETEDHGFCGSSIEEAYRNTERNGGCY